MTFSQKKSKRVNHIGVGQSGLLLWNWRDVIKMRLLLIVNQTMTSEPGGGTVRAEACYSSKWLQHRQPASKTSPWLIFRYDWGPNLATLPRVSDESHGLCQGGGVVGRVRKWLLAPNMLCCRQKTN